MHRKFLALASVLVLAFNQPAEARPGRCHNEFCFLFDWGRATVLDPVTRLIETPFRHRFARRVSVRRSRSRHELDRVASSGPDRRVQMSHAESDNQTPRIAHPVIAVPARPTGPGKPGRPERFQSQAAVPVQAAPDTLEVPKADPADADADATGSQPLPRDYEATSVTARKDDRLDPSYRDNRPKDSADVPTPDKLTDFFFFDGAKIFGLLQATGYSDYEPHEMPAAVVALEPSLSQYLFAKRPDGGIGIVDMSTHKTIGLLKYRDPSVGTK